MAALRRAGSRPNGAADRHADVCWQPMTRKRKPRVAAFDSGLRELGWLDGRNLRIEYRWADGRRRSLAPHTRPSWPRTPPDVILATGSYDR